MELSNNILIKTRKRKTPFLLTDLSAIERNYVRLQKALPGSKIFFAIKSNYDPGLIGRLNSIGSCFDVASWTEINLSLKQGVDPSRLLFSAPVKIASEINKAFNAGVRMFVYDSVEELEKIAKHAPQSQVILRIYVESTDSKCPMFTRFGVASSDAVDYLLKAKEFNLQPFGLTFHVGSQCTDAKSWQMALSIAQKIWSNALNHQLQLELLDLGGGLPVPYSEEVPAIEDILSEVNTSIKNDFAGLKHVYIEPGRYMTDQASVMIATVIGVATRGQTQWLHLDVGGFNGLFEIIEGFDYEIVTEHPERPKRTYAVSGPTCDGLDVIRKEIELPEVHLGERVAIMNAGAYSTSMQLYNGFPWARSYVLEGSTDIK